MKNIFTMIIIAGMAGGAYAAEFSDLAVKAGDLKPAAASKIIPARAQTPAAAESVVVKKILGYDAVVQEYCRVETNAHFENCGAPPRTKQLDLIYAPKAVGDRIVQHLRQAYNGGYYKNLDKVDLFHGHYITRGPQTLYASAGEFFGDLTAILYHSREYIPHSWQDIGPNEDIMTPRLARSFFGWFAEDKPELRTAISLIAPNVKPKTYKTAGTIYTDEVVASLPGLSEHKYTSFAGEEKLFINTCGNDGQAGCKPCEFFNMAYIIADPNGRFMSPDGVRFDVSFHCVYRPEY